MRTSASSASAARNERADRPVRHLRAYTFLLLGGAVTILLDQASKQLALLNLADGPIRIAGPLQLRLTYNAGGAFGILQNAPGLFLVASLAIVGVILVWGGRIDDPGWTLPLGLVAGGGAGNAVDRILRDTAGRVVDFIDVGAWPVFNLADAAIVTGVGLLVLASMREPQDA